MADSDNDGSDTPSAPTTTPPETTAPTNPKEWKSLPPMNTRRWHAGGVCVNNHQFLVMGGSGGSSNALSSCEYYDKNTNTWTNLSVDLPYPCNDFGVASVGDRVFVVGGYDGSSKSRSDLHSIHVPGGDLSTLAGGNWETLAPMTRARSRFACVSDSRYIYVFGGITNKSWESLDTAEQYDTETNEWTTLYCMPEKRQFCAAGMVGNKIYVVGGENPETRSLASTSVFDTSKQQWELSTATSDTKDRNNPASASAPAVPNMKTKRSQMSVVVVDHFLIAMGGRDGGGDYHLSSIEVFDTERNAWNNAPAPMKDSREKFVAGVWKGTDEIVVAGGLIKADRVFNFDLNTAECISFQSGLLPPGFRIRERGQKIMGDTEQGKDQLGLAIIAIALVEMILFLDLDPPFVLGIFGQWGKGKSFFFNLMLEAMIDIQKKQVDNFIRTTYPGHIYFVKFDSWTFAKGCIWSSMMYQILKALNEYLQFEQKVIEKAGEQALLEGTVSTIEVFRDLMKGEREYLEEHKEIWEEIKKNGDRASGRLLEAIDACYKNDQDELKKVQEEIHQEQTLIHKERTEKQATHAVEEMKELLNFFGKRAVETILERALKKAMEPGDNEIGDSESNGDNESGNSLGDTSAVEEAMKPSDDESGNSEEDAIVSDLIQAIKDVKWFYYRFQISNIPPVAFICAAALLILAIVLLQTFENKIGGAISVLISPMIAVITSLSSAMKQIRPIVEELKDKVNTKEDLEVGNFGNANLKKLHARKAKLENQMFALEGSSLQEVVADKFDKNVYEANLGIVHKVQQDLQLISDAMLNTRQRGIFPRGEPRIVLFVDDLDRVEKDVVVEVIEALQLLVKTKLFVAVLAIDARYVTLSIENHYEGILDPQTPPSGMDFLEKIIQVPFRLPGVEQNHVDTFVRSQIEIERSQDISKAKETTVESTDSADSADSNTPESQQAEENLVPDKNSEEDVLPDDKALPRDKVLFSPKEADMMIETLKLFGVGPRCMKRIINVFKVLQVIWKRGSSQFPVDFELKRATLFLMLMASDESTRDITHQVFDWMDKGRVKYHYVAPDGDDKNDLSKLLQTKLRQWDKDFEFSFSGGKTKKGTLMASIEKYLSKYTWEDIDGWIKISSQFFLARSFSFFRLATDEIEMKQKQLGASTGPEKNLELN